MLFYSLSFLLGDIFFHYFTYSYGLFWILISSLFVVVLYKFKFKYNKIIIAFVFGFSWALLYSNHQLSWVFPENLEDKPINIIGTISSIPECNSFQCKFLLKIKEINHQAASGKIKLSWRSPVDLIVGDQWNLSVKLKRIHGLKNPDSFDYESWAFQEGIKASGYVIRSEKNYLIKRNWVYDPIDQIRQHLKSLIEKNVSSSETSPWVMALAVGERQNIKQANWEVLRNTGTNHLMAIAGLHIGALSEFVYIFVNIIWKLFPKKLLKFPSSHAATLAALFAAIFYSALAGFSIPTQRACIMLAMYSILILTRRNYSVWTPWAIALIMVLIINPLSILSESFYLSFGSVALIIYGISGRLNPRGVWWKWGRIQWVIAIGLFPLCIGLFHQFSLISFVANSIAIPWVTFLIVPLVLTGCLCLVFCEKLGSFLLFLADKNLGYLWKILAYLSHFHWAVWYQSIPNYWMIIFACIGIMMLLFPQGLPGRWFGIIWLLPIILYFPEKPRIGEVKFTLLDVGQGLASVVETNHHVLVFDAGARLNDNQDMGENVVVPFLRSRAVQYIDMLVISHGDNDHIGGANAIIKSFPIKAIKTSEPENFQKGLAEYCLRGQSWVWDGVKFEFLYPPIKNIGLDNNSSCVLKVSTYQQGLLLTGDIEKLAERYLVDYDGDNLHSDILVAPHHGSKTSAEDDFIIAVNPSYVLFSAGYHNRYHLPNKEVISKYHALNIQQYSTVDLGAIECDLSLNTKIIFYFSRNKERSTII